MEKVFDLLSKNNLIDDEHIESRIMHSWSTTRIIDFKDSFVDLIQTTSPLSKEQLNLSTYTFVANADMSAQHSSCPAWSCRLRRIDGLARFSALYSDCVYIRNYFVDYEHLPSNRYEEYNFRYLLAGDLKIMIALKPLMTAGVVRFVQPPEPGFHMCPSCAERLIPTFKEVNSALEKHISVLDEKYIEQTSATLYHTPVFPGEPYTIEASGPEELYENGQTLFTRARLPRSLLARLKSTPNGSVAKGLQLSKSEIAKAGFVQDSLRVIAIDIWMQYLMSRVSGMNLKYLTNRDIDISFLEAVTKDEDFKRYNNVLRNHLIYELPILQDVPLTAMLDIRRNEYDAFLTYRDGMNKVIKEYISQRKKLSSLEAREIHEDIVQPKLNELNARVKSIKRSLLRKPALDITIAVGILTIGLYSNLLTPEAGKIVAALGGIPALKSLIQSIVEAAQTPQEIRNDSFYFLWKLSKK